MKETYEEKKNEVLRVMALKEIENELTKLKKWIQEPNKIGDIDLAEVRRISGLISNRNKKIMNINVDPGLEKEIYLFAFKGKFHLITAGQYRKIEDAEVRKQLDAHSDMKIYYLCTDEGMCPLPPALTSKQATGVQVKDDQAVIDYIKRVSGVEVKETDL